MSLTVAVANYNHGKYLAQCLETCVAFSDQVLLYDDASTDNSLQVSLRFPSVFVKARAHNSGSPVWGSTQSIKDCRTTHLAWVDADNFMVRRPEETDADYTFFNMIGTHEDGTLRRVYRHAKWPTDLAEGMARFLDNPDLMPFPWGGVWRMDFLRGKTWLDFTTCPACAPDYRTSIEWALDRPSLKAITDPYLAVRMHEGRMSCQADKLALCRAEAAGLAAAIRRSWPL